MSIYGHFTHQYYGNKIIFPEQSFLIAGISFYKENCTNITYDTELFMKDEPDNKYDNTAVCILHNQKIIGYVPSHMKELCKKHINESLKIINIKHINGNCGIRVIPLRFYVYDPLLKSKILFSD
jgi:hypothetical protein